ncbi:TonB-dependent receptor [Alistipes onderdonkii]|jgi:TonB-linked SusC/RagA family outer membrane protein|uniref:SusC/RagA family TonB-linked outer membrane protein n=1 Tax=Alistipes onderdonkii TaxID=328813 RepID=UPI00050A1E6B|nr:TonB-dependent receptor [Alistipes onderdonkii]
MKMNLTTSEKNRGIVRFLLMSMLLCLLIHPAQAQDRVTVTGRLTDTSHAPLIGASVIEQGTTNGVTTDAEGNYQISVSGNATLGFSFIGYKPQNVAVMNRTAIDVTLEEDATMIGEVVAIGYGSQRKEDLSMAVTTVKLDEAAKSRASNLATILQGRMPGVTVQQTGDPMKPASFTIRGRGSKGNDDDPTSGDGVLVVVDGVPNAPYMMEDVETITVLKDAASAAIYGASVGSSGVILITTKKAQSGKLRVDVNVSLGFEKVTNLPNMLTAEQYNEVWARTVENNPGSQLPSAANPEVYPWGNVTRTDWLDEIFQTGFTQHYAATISGGSDKVQSIFSVSYDKKDGVLLNTYSESFNGKLQTDFKLTNWLKISERASFVVSNGQGNVDTSHQGPIMGAVWYPRAASVYEMNEDGTYARDEKGNRYYGGTSPEWADVNGTPMLYNPVAYLERMHRKYPEHKIFSTTSIEIKPISSLTIKSDFTIDLRNKESDEFYPTMTEKGLRRDINYREQFFDRDNHWLSETIATYAQVFGRHHISAMAGFTADFKRLHSRKVYSRGYPDNDINSSIWDQANDWTSNTPKESKYEQTMVSFLARLGYSFDDRYFLVGSVRRDASSKLPASKNYDWFPSVSGSWKLSSEKFFRNAGLDKVFDLVKFRAGWGRIGNVDLYPNNVATVELLNYQYPIIFGQNLDQLLQGTYLNTIPNYSARWETTEQTSAGLDLTMFKNKLNISVDYYHKVTKDLIDYIPTPEQIGVADPPMGNMGNVLNKGWEFSVNYNGSAAQGKLTYNVWGNFSTNKGYVREYGVRKGAVMHTSPNLNSNPILYSDAGQPWYSFMVYRTAGIFRSQDEINKYIYKNPETGEAKLLMPDAKVGDLIFIDTNNDGVINDDDKTFAGSYTPKNTFSFGGSLNWKGFDFSFFFQGVTGNKVYNGLKQMAMNGRNDYGNLISDVYNSWDFNPQGSKYPRLGLVTGSDTNGNYSKFSDIFLEDGDYLRLKNITLGYTLPKSVSRFVGMENGSLRVYMSVDNVCTITGYSGVDPEVGNYGIDRGVYPVSRFFNFGVNINF